MKVTLKKDYDMNGIIKKKGTVLDVTTSFGEELVKKKIAFTGGEDKDDKEFKKVKEKNKELQETDKTDKGE